MMVFDFSNRLQLEETIKETWNEFRTALSCRKFLYSEIDKAKESNVFLHQFDELFTNCHKYFDFSIEDVLTKSTFLIRAGRIHSEDTELTYSRFIPNKKYIKQHNRFSPPGTEWLYLAVGDINSAEKCALRECRAATGEKFGLCRFLLNEKYNGKKLVDLTIANDISYDELNKELEASAKEILKREKDKALKMIFKKGYFSPVDISDYKEKLYKWTAFTYARLISKQIFVPLETEDRELIYSPFQCLAQYFLSLGYEGVVYSSTVFSEGKNVVLFDKDAAKPIGEIKTLIYNE